MIRILFFSVVVFFSISSSATAQKGDKIVVSYTMSADQTWLVQNALYSLNYDLGPPDSKYGAQTKAAIAKWKSNTNRPSGDITKEEMEYLIAIDTKEFVYAALAASTDGTYSATWSSQSREGVTNRMMNSCKEKSDHPEKCGVTVVLSATPRIERWIAALQCSRKTLSSPGVDFVTQRSGNTRDEVTDKVYKVAENDGFARDACDLLTVIEARGRHK